MMGLPMRTAFLEVHDLPIGGSSAQVFEVRHRRRKEN